MNTLFAAVVNGIVASAAIACAVCLVLRLVPLNWLNAATRYAVWWAVLLVVAALPFRYAFSENGPGKVALVRLRVGDATSVQAEPPRVTSVPLPAIAMSSAGIRPRSRASFHPAFPVLLRQGPWPARIVTFWLVASVLMFIRLIASVVMLERRKGRASEVPPVLAACVAGWVASCGGSHRRIRLASSREIPVPLVAGPWRPTILLPARLQNDLSESELEQIGIHEAAHLVRRDDCALLIQRVLGAVFALHPVMRWISNRIDLEREIACDDFVIAATGDTKPYAACLARVVELSGGVRRHPVAAAAAEGRSHLARRVEMLFDATRNAGTRLLGVRLAVVAGCIGALSWGAVQTRGLLAFAQSFAAPAQGTAPAAPVIDMVPPGLPMVTLMAQVTAPVAAPPFPTAPANAEPPKVFIPVEVRDPLGRFVTGLGKDVFKVQEDGVAQTITELLDQDTPADAYVIIEPPIGPILDTLDRGNGDFRVIVYNANIRQPTPLLDAIRATGQNAQKNAGNRQAMLILPTSAPNMQNYSEAELRAAFSALTMPVYTFEVLDTASPSQPSTSPILTDVAIQSGGQHVTVAKAEDLPDAVHQVLIAVRNLYFVGYVPSNSTRDGAYRRVEVTLAAPRGLPKLTANSRPGYIAPAQ